MRKRVRLSQREEEEGGRGKDRVEQVERTRGCEETDERTLTSYYLLIANSFSLVAY